MYYSHIVFVAQTYMSRTGAYRCKSKAVRLVFIWTSPCTHLPANSILLSQPGGLLMMHVARKRGRRIMQASVHYYYIWCTRPCYLISQYHHCDKYDCYFWPLCCPDTCTISAHRHNKLRNNLIDFSWLAKNFLDTDFKALLPGKPFSHRWPFCKPRYRLHYSNLRKWL